jgi:hypothetical protein
LIDVATELNRESGMPHDSIVAAVLAEQRERGRKPIENNLIAVFPEMPKAKEAKSRGRRTGSRGRRTGADAGRAQVVAASMGQVESQSAPMERP